MIRELLAIAVGGAAGSIARYLLSYVVLGSQFPFGFPIGTFAVNAIGSLLIGIFMATLHSQTLAVMGIVGFCGGFTTFSTFSTDALRFIRCGEYASAGIYIALSVGVCIAFAALGVWIGQLIKN